MIDRPYLSENMIKMRDIYGRLVETVEGRHMIAAKESRAPIVEEFQRLTERLLDRDEVLMALYLAVTRFNQVGIFNFLLVKNHSFQELEPEWYLLFTEKNVFATLRNIKTSAQRSQFNAIVLLKALQNDYQFIVSDMLDGRAPITNKIVELLIRENQKKLLVSLISIPKNLEASHTRPKYFHLDSKQYQQAIREAFLRAKSPMAEVYGGMGEKELHFQDIIAIALQMYEK